MYYFLSDNIYAFNSGTEFSQFNRVKLFNKDEVHAKIVTSAFDPILHKNMEDHGLTNDDVINVYDYFQNTTNVKRKKVNLRLTSVIPKTDYHIEYKNANVSEIKNNGRVIARVNVMPETIGLVGNIEHLDQFNNVGSKEFWDWRGFKSMEEFYLPDGRISSQIYFNLAGERVLETTFMNVNDKQQQTMWRLINYRGHNYQFDTEAQFLEFFYNELNQDNNSTFISDRRNCDLPLANVEHAKKWVFVHDNHVTNGMDTQNSPIYQGYSLSFTEEPEKFTGILVATERQKQDIESRFKVHVKVAPDSFIPDSEKISEAELNQQLSTRFDKKQFLYVGRISPEKQLDEMFKIFAEIHKELPKSTLKVQGYVGDQNYKKELDDLIKSLKIEDSIIFAPYSSKTADVLKTYDESMMLLSTSRGEGYGITTVEAISQGLPTLAYDVPYGPREIIQDSKNGYLVHYHNRVDAINKLLDISNDQDKYNEMSKNCLALADNYSYSNTRAKWRSVTDSY
ncbi:glycosyltransferase [Fructilactobacillus vespulae]|uniref:glycosyltransferase n=1 Tax=Fructilactobacillus vespulae TaxID=1249630 RepID=UPI0039B36FA0